MPYAIMRFSKQRGGSASALEKHHEREKSSYNSNRDIDPLRTLQNYHIKPPCGKYYYEIQSRIEAAKCKVRSDSIKFVDTFIGGTNSFITALPPEEQHEYFKRAYDFISGRVGEKNIFSAVVHMDEATPHMHLCFVPLTKDLRLSAKQILGNRADLVKWQDDFHAHMSARWDVLERGEAARETNRKHIPVRLFKQAARLDRDSQSIQAALADINAFNAGKKREEALSLLSRWLPDAKSFAAQLGTVDNYIKGLEIGKRDSSEEIGVLEDKAFEKGAKLKIAESELRRLQKQIKEQRVLLAKIPPDVLKTLVEQREKIR